MPAPLAKPSSGRPARPSLRAEPTISFLPASRVPLVEPAIRYVSDSLLAHPELPKPPASPRLRPGRDFTPMPGAQLVASERPARSLTPSMVQPSRGSGIALAVFAVLVGFTGGLLVAWFAGLI
jgi:hypothetical protein